MYIQYEPRSGIEYAALMESHRNKKDTEKTLIEFLGRVLDKERKIFKSRKRGVYTYDLETNTFGKAPEDFVPNIKRKNRKKEKLLVDFGDSYIFNELIHMWKLEQAIEAIPYGNPDSLKALLMYYILDNDNNNHAEDWFDGNYTKILYPKANLTSQRISEMLESIGTEDKQRIFFKAYLKVIDDTITKDCNILIDSTGLPNNIRIPITSTNNHNGRISNEIRLIYVVQQKTRLPLYMRYVSGSIVDTTTLLRTLKELKQIGINTKFAILDAGYMTEAGIKSLKENNISFIVRCPSNRKIYKDVVSKHIDDLECDQNLAVDSEGKLYNGREVFLKRVDVDYKGMKLYAYLARDKEMEFIERHDIIRRSRDDDEKYIKEGHCDRLKKCGLFMLLSSRRIKADIVLEHYYIRQDVEQIFDIVKNYTPALPLCSQKENSFRGHMLLTFIATAVLQMSQNITKNSNTTLKSIFKIMRNQKAKVYEDAVIPSEPDRKQNEIYKLFHIKSPSELPIPS